MGLSLTLSLTLTLTLILILTLTRGGHSMSACGKWLVVFGGLRNRACLNDAAALDTERMVWQPLEVEG